MRLSGSCRHCGSTCEWERNDATGRLVPDWPCAPSPTGACEPRTAGDSMVRRLTDAAGRRADQRRRGFVTGGKRRPR